VGFYHEPVKAKSTLVALALATTLSAACSGGSPAVSPAASGPPASNAAIAPLLPTSVTALPNTDVAAFHQLLAQLKGTPVVVNIWASWCTPCVAEAPLLKAAAQKNPQIQFLGVDIQDSRNGAVGFLISHAIPYPSLFDPAGAIRTDLGSIGQPVTVFYDAAGNQVAKVDGQMGADQLAADIAKI
jgi:thiol-disulfide isomerase/thioredoxin